MVSSSDFLRASERPTAIATLNRQRHLTPSCGGSTPTAERTVGAARISLESLTPRPGIHAAMSDLSPLCAPERTCPELPNIPISLGSLAAWLPGGNPGVGRLGKYFMRVKRRPQLGAEAVRFPCVARVVTDDAAINSSRATLVPPLVWRVARTTWGQLYDPVHGLLNLITRRACVNLGRDLSRTFHAAHQ